MDSWERKEKRDLFYYKRAREKKSNGKEEGREDGNWEGGKLRRANERSD